MIIADLPPAQHEQVLCSIEAAATYKIPANVLLAVAEQEGGKPGQWVKNTNETYDVGSMQFNTAYLKDLVGYGISAEDVAQSGCYPYYLAAWRIKYHVTSDQGEYWSRVANYHSKTPEKNEIYRQKIMSHAAKWSQWLSDNMLPAGVEKVDLKRPPMPFKRGPDVAALKPGAITLAPATVSNTQEFVTDNATIVKSKYQEALQASSSINIAQYISNTVTKGLHGQERGNQQ